MSGSGPRKEYYKLKRTYDPAGDISPTDFFFMLRKLKHSCLLKGASNGGQVTHNGQVPEEDELFTATLESDVVSDWLEAIGGGQLLDYVLDVFSDELKKKTLGDLWKRINDRLESLKIDMNEKPEESSREFHPNALIAFGGTLNPWDEEDGALTTGQCFNFETNSWSDLENMEENRLCCGVAQLGRRVFLVGGERLWGWMNMVDEYKSDTDTWTYTMPAMNFIRQHPGAAGMDHHIYAAGGLHAPDGYTVCLNTAEVLDVTLAHGDRKWKPIANMNNGRHQFGMGALNGKIYVCGGDDFGGKGLLSSVETYDPVENVWSPVADLSSPRCGSAVAVQDGFLYCIGGGVKKIGEMLNIVEKYDPSTNTWTRVKDMNHGRRGAGAVSWGGRLYVVGGYDGDVCQKSMECYDPQTDTWTMVPGEMWQKRCDHAVALIERK